MATFDTKYLIGWMGGYYRLAVGIEAATGHVADLDTGLNTVIAAWAVPKSDNPATATEAGYVTVDFDGDDGLVDIYCWQDDVATEAATETTVMVFAIGT
jgi:hypothetical protein